MAQECPELYFTAIRRAMHEGVRPATHPDSLVFPDPDSPEWPSITYDCWMADDTTFNGFYQGMLDAHIANSDAESVHDLAGGIIYDFTNVEGRGNLSEGGVTATSSPGSPNAAIAQTQVV